MPCAGGRFEAKLQGSLIRHKCDGDAIYILAGLVLRDSGDGVQRVSCVKRIGELWCCQNDFLAPFLFPFV